MNRLGVLTDDTSCIKRFAGKLITHTQGASGEQASLEWLSKEQRVGSAFLRPGGSEWRRVPMPGLGLEIQTSRWCPELGRCMGFPYVK